MAQARPTYPLLAIDASSKTTWAGVKTSPEALVCLSSTEDPSKSLFRLAEALLDQTETPLAKLGSIVFCEGPGSMLGTRTAVMSIRAWRGISIPAARNLFAYNSLELGRQRVAETFPADEPLLIVTDGRRNSWHCLGWPADLTENSVFTIENEALENDPRPAVTFPEFARWTKTAKPLQELAYDPTPSFRGEGFLEIVRSVEQADPLALRANEFKKWTPKFHSAPTQ